MGGGRELRLFLGKNLGDRLCHALEIGNKKIENGVQ